MFCSRQAIALAVDYLRIKASKMQRSMIILCECNKKDAGFI